MEYRIETDSMGEIEADNAQFHYVYGLSLQNFQAKKAKAAIRMAYEVSGNPQYLYTLCEMQIKGNALQARQCLNELSEVASEVVVEVLRNQMTKAAESE